MALMPVPPKVGKGVNKGKVKQVATGAAPAPVITGTAPVDAPPVIMADPPVLEVVVDNAPIVTPDPPTPTVVDNVPPVVPDPEGTHRFNLEPGKPPIDPDPEEIDEEILELLAAYMAAYPNNKVFHIASDGQVFLSSNKLDANTHEKNMGGKLRSYQVK